MAGFLDKQDRIVDMVMTGLGKSSLSRGLLNFSYWKAFDDEVDYDPYIANSASFSDEKLEELILEQIESSLVREATTGYKITNRQGSDFTNVKNSLYDMPHGQTVVPRMILTSDFKLASADPVFQTTNFYFSGSFPDFPGIQKWFSFGRDTNSMSYLNQVNPIPVVYPYALTRDSDFNVRVSYTASFSDSLSGSYSARFFLVSSDGPRRSQSVLPAIRETSFTGSFSESKTITFGNVLLHSGSSIGLVGQILPQSVSSGTGSLFLSLTASFQSEESITIYPTVNVKQTKVADLYSSRDVNGKVLGTLGPYDRGYVRSNSSSTKISMKYTGFPADRLSDGILVRVLESGSDGYVPLFHRRDLENTLSFNADLRMGVG